MFARPIHSQFHRNNTLLHKCNHLIQSSNTQSTHLQQRNFINALKQFKLRPTTATKTTQNNSKLWNYLSKRRYSPGSDYHELSQSAWKENRFYRYYKFSDKVDQVRALQRGYAAGIITLSLYFLMGYVLLVSALPTSNHFVQLRRHMNAIKERYEGMAKSEVMAHQTHEMLKYDKARREESEATKGMTRLQYMKENTSYRASQEGRTFYNRGLIHEMIAPGSQPDYIWCQESKVKRDAEYQAYIEYLKKNNLQS